MGSWWRIAVPRGHRHDMALARRADQLGYSGVLFRSFDLYFVAGCSESSDIEMFVEALLSDGMANSPVIGTPSSRAGELRIEVALRPGVTDRVASQAEVSARSVGLDVRVATGSSHMISGLPDDGTIGALVSELLANPVIETWACGDVIPGFVVADDSHSGVETIPIRSMSSSGLADLNRHRGLALDPDELEAIWRWCSASDRDLHDVEIEMIAQTWSEHCAHKTFRARIDVDGRTVKPLLTQLRESTIEIDAPFVVSAFDGNAGIVKFGGLAPLAVKVETHNHPSAVEPFGGANTGVGGVVRDVLAAPARPIALTDVLCFGRTDVAGHSVPQGTFHPSLVEDGVVAGIADYGNKIGVPTVAGAVVYDDGFMSNPLVFCGCVGSVLPGGNMLDGPHPGDRIMVIGGAAGRDGIRGATFSSMTMDVTTGRIAGASVQIGDPIVERMVGEVLEELFSGDDPPCTAITDCGAGGLSSAVGEMGETTGARVQLRSVPRKYPGLAPWEVWLSEAQERMVLAVPASRVDEVLACCARKGVLAAEIGEFTDDGRMLVLDGDEIVVDLPMDFLHGGRPQRHMVAVRGVEKEKDPCREPVVDLAAMLLALLAHPTIASKERIIRCYDHEVLGHTVIGPMAAPHQHGPSDGAVIAEPLAREGFALGIGMNPTIGVFDPYAMAWGCVDEAIRNAVCLGADPRTIALLDNFSWGDPTRPETLGGLVAAVEGCCDAAKAFAAPFVSGKDSLNNEYLTEDGIRRSVPPTLVVTALAHVPDADATPASSFTGVGNLVVVTGTTRDEMRGSHLDLVLGRDGGGRCPSPDEGAPERYVAIHRLIASGHVVSAHDASEGGLAVALAEMVLGAPDIGVEADIGVVHPDAVVSMFAESVGRIILEVPASSLDHVLASTGGVLVGTTVSGSHLHLVVEDDSVSLAREQLLRAWGGHR